jgi:hypothetical protein
VFIQEENTQWNVEKRKNGKEERWWCRKEKGSLWG